MKKSYMKYKKYPTMELHDRTWPSKTMDQAPVWCSVDLRDGNQALPVPMGIEAKLEFFNLIKSMGYKEIEIGFPSASDTEYNFLRTLIEEGYITDDIKVQVLVQAREHLIAKTFEALKGAKKAIVHVYNSTSTQQRDVVFGKSQEEIKAMAIQGAKWLQIYAAKYPETEFTFEYSPESFTGTEMEYALEVSNAVIDVWQPTPEHKMILNLPATVEMSTPNVYADQVEWFSRHINRRDSVLISLHTHNDRGTGVAATELGLLAGADRVEGTLFGNGERTGNVDILTLALNLFTQGVDPGVKIDEVNKVIEVYERCTGMSVHQRHPYAGELVYTAFSGSHQDAIRKGLKANEKDSTFWNVPYLPIDPADIGRQYEPIIRINSQSGKGGVAYILEEAFGYKLPKGMHPEISLPVQKMTDQTGKELTALEIKNILFDEFINVEGTFQLESFKSTYQEENDQVVMIEAKVILDGVEKTLQGQGNGPISAFIHGLQKEGNMDYELISYDEHAIGIGENAEAIAYIQLKNHKGISAFGLGIDRNTSKASIKAIISSINRLNR
ncbi:2-isopropylmalate synthase [Petrocella atlantisensis]|uniref:2-isopropylmalate synthase n=1 Tax=Petrocella atlantisensis TaxID=2173034 RepID=A0A3P7S221_9FIRM|nr:2-isopropylmalate synthase [Petrocella atlantisensis]PKM55626.1 MAG: 2-isopropylmalate synthase [Firmicutes bacterium HGW-Firmicutes-5]VDN46829.1 2-isopropylmalate synthase [Petrocella atlantisensis]